MIYSTVQLTEGFTTNLAEKWIIFQANHLAWY